MYTNVWISAIFKGSVVNTCKKCLWIKQKFREGEVTGMLNSVASAIRNILTDCKTMDSIVVHTFFLSLDSVAIN
jgi:Zn-finger protein